MQAISIPARCGIRRNLKQLANLFKSVFVPNLQDDDLPLLRWQRGQSTHRLAFSRALGFGTLKPSLGLKLPGNSPPQTPSIIQGPIAKCSHTIVLRFRRNFSPLHERYKGFLDHILRLAMAQA